jgi:hypothetical protein
MEGKEWLKQGETHLFSYIQEWACLTSDCISRNHPPSLLRVAIGKCHKISCYGCVEDMIYSLLLKTAC